MPDEAKAEYGWGGWLALGHALCCVPFIAILLRSNCVVNGSF